MLDLNQRPPACEAGALPIEQIDRFVLEDPLANLLTGNRQLSSA